MNTSAINSFIIPQGQTCKPAKQIPRSCFRKILNQNKTKKVQSPWSLPYKAVVNKGLTIDTC